MATTLISEEMQALVGQEYGRSVTSVPISLSDIRKWALAVYYPEVPPRLFWDEEYANASVHGGVVAPEEFNPFAWITADGPVMPPTFTGAVRNSGPEAAFDVAAPATNFILNGGMSVRYGVRMRPGDVITSSRSKLVGYKETQSRLGPMLFTTTAATWTNQDGAMVKVTESTLIRY